MSNGIQSIDAVWILINAMATTLVVFMYLPRECQQNMRVSSKFVDILMLFLTFLCPVVQGKSVADVNIAGVLKFFALAWQHAEGK